MKRPAATETRVSVRTDSDIVTRACTAARWRCSSASRPPRDARCHGDLRTRTQHPALRARRRDHADAAAHRRAPRLMVAAATRPGIPDVQRALQDGYSTSGRLGLGLPGVQRLVTTSRSTRISAGTTSWSRNGPCSDRPDRVRAAARDETAECKDVPLLQNRDMNAAAASSRASVLASARLPMPNHGKPFRKPMRRKCSSAGSDIGPGWSLCCGSTRLTSSTNCANELRSFPQIEMDAAREDHLEHVRRNHADVRGGDGHR